MKIRNGFVSNSSSSSFIIQKENLTEEQLEKLRALKNDTEVTSSYWKFEETDEEFSGYTDMDNIDLRSYMMTTVFNVPTIEWRD